MPRPKRPARQLRARLPNDMLSAAARLPLAELVPSGLLRDLCDALVSHVYSVAGKTPLVAYASLVGHHPHRGHQELTLLHYPRRTAGDCLAQATVCVHPVGCRDLNASVETGDGLWKPLGAGDVFLSLYKEGATPGSAHRVRWTSREAAVPCVCLRVLMIAA
jgi:hypothetical protein